MQIVFSGAAGTGVNTLGMLFGKYLSSHGYIVLGDREYASTIKGDNNLFLLSFRPDGGLSSLDRKVDIFLSLDDFGVTKNQEIYDLRKVCVMPKELPYKRRNMYLMGQAIRYIGHALSDFEHFLASEVLWVLSPENIEPLRAGFDSIEPGVILTTSIGPKRKFLSGNEILIQGAVASGLNFYSAYPMTPASTLIDEVVRFPEQVTFIQGEDEIAVAMLTLGAKYAGARAMCGTSGGGFALMSESLSYSAQAELGGVYVLSQRAGPSTGTPTFQEQGDLMYAINATFGDVRPIVLTPSSYERSYRLIGEALNLSDILQHPVIVLVDKQWSESYVSVDPSDLIPTEIHRGKLIDAPSIDYARYALTGDGISPYTIPGTEHGEQIAPSYEHDEYGATSELPVLKSRMTEKREQKLRAIEDSSWSQDLSREGGHISRREAKKFFVLYGFQSSLLESYLVAAGKEDFGVITLERISPFPQMIVEFLRTQATHIEELVFIDGNISHELYRHISSEVGLDRYYAPSQIRKATNYHLYPWWSEDFAHVISSSLDYAKSTQ